MGRELAELADRPMEPEQLRIAGINARLSETLFRHIAGIAAPRGTAQSCSHIFAKAQHLADFAHGAARTVMDDGGGDTRALTAITFVNILHHLFTPLMLKIDVDIRRLSALLREEAGEEQVIFDRIDRGNAKQVANGRIGR